MLEAFELATKVGAQALTPAELAFLKDAEDRKGCRCKKNELSLEERMRVCNLGAKMRDWKEAHQCARF
jgi:hypothetical protein